VSPQTNRVYPPSEKPWVIFFYYEKCGWCKIFKPLFEVISAKNQEVARFGIADGFIDEYLKETFKMHAFPTIIVLREDRYYEYNGDRSEEKIIEFVKKGYLDVKDPPLIPTRVGPIRL
jgi:thioredoxin-like negative regulator of GroEL